MRSLNNSMTHHLAHLLCTGWGSDVDVVTADGTVHHLHRFLLGSVSPVLAELIQRPDPDEDGADGRMVLRDVFARFPSDHIRVIIAMAYCVEVKLDWNDKFGPNFVGTNGDYHSKRSPACIMALFETLAYFRVPLPQWLQMKSDGNVVLCSSAYGMQGGQCLGFHTTYRDDDNDKYLDFTKNTERIKVQPTSDGVFDYPEAAIRMINSHFESKEMSIGSFRLLRRSDGTATDVEINGSIVATLSNTMQIRVDQLCEKWMRLQNQME